MRPAGCGSLLALLRQQLFQLPARPCHAIFGPDFLAYRRSLLRIAGVVQQTLQLPLSPHRVVSLDKDAAGDAQLHRTPGIVRLIEGEGHRRMGRPERSASAVVPMPP